MSKNKMCIALGLLLLSGTAWAADQGPRVAARLPSPFEAEFSPGVTVPLGDSASVFRLGGGGTLGLVYAVPGWPLSLGGGLAYGFSPVQAASSISLTATRLKANLTLPLGAGLGFYGSGSGGWYFAAKNDLSATANNPYLAAGLGLDWVADPGVHVQLGGEYQQFAGLFRGVSLGLGLTVALGNLGGSATIPGLRLNPVFPVFYKHYDDHPVGTVTIRNDLPVPLTDLSTSLFIRAYMDAPKAVELPGPLAPGLSRDVELFGLFTDRLLGITEGTKVAAEVTVRFSAGGRVYTDTSVQTLTILGRNAMTWDDNRKAAAYVTSKDPEVLNFSRTVTSAIKAQEKRLINEKLVAAMALHAALDLEGINYTRNPVTPYDQVSTNGTAIDFLQFPRETFQYRAGDCSDLSILYAALFQAIGIDAAFVTVPGHIFVAFDTGLSARQAEQDLFPANTTIVHGGTVWVPLEITSRHDGFEKAWRLGAEEWTAGVQAGVAEFWPVQEAWKVYQPVGLPGSGSEVRLPPMDQIAARYERDSGQWLNLALTEPKARLEQAEAGPLGWVASNKLGILLAKYGRPDDAETKFLAALAAKPDYLPALQNLANLEFLGGRYPEALAALQKAGLLDPTNGRTLLMLARTNQAMKNDKAAELQFAQLQVVAPELAAQDRQANAAKGGRASSVAEEQNRVAWTGEE